MLPLVLAQLLIQFQQPIITEQANNNATNSLINDTIGAQLNRSTRSIPAYQDDLPHNNLGDNFMKDRFFAPDYSGKIVIVLNYSIRIFRFIDFDKLSSVDSD